MAIVRCLQCKSDYSEVADTCPKCTFTNDVYKSQFKLHLYEPESKKASSLLSLLGFLGVVFALGAIIIATDVTFSRRMADTERTSNARDYMLPQ